MAKIKKGDKVIVITGDDKGKEGSVLEVFRKEDKVLIEGVNVKKKHMRAQAGTPGQIVERAHPIHISNVAVKKSKKAADKVDKPKAKAKKAETKTATTKKTTK